MRMRYIMNGIVEHTFTPLTKNSETSGILRINILLKARYATYTYSHIQQYGHTYTTKNVDFHCM
jgi:hypothetical protein